MSPPEKRDAVVGVAAEPPEKRAKLEDDDHKEMSFRIRSDIPEENIEPPPIVYPIPAYCDICDAHVGHECVDCPDKSTGMGLLCMICLGPCKMSKDDPAYDPEEHVCLEMVKYCSECMQAGQHWVDDCPFRSEATELEYYAMHGIITEFDEEVGF